MNIKLTIFITVAIFFSCTTHTRNTGTAKPVHFVTLAPGHFHAALVQKTMYDDADPVVHVYAPAGKDLQQHLERIRGYNERADGPTTWKEEVYEGPDYLARMLNEKKGNVVVLAGNNGNKAAFISKSLEAGFNVLADKPMAIDAAGFAALEKDFAKATDQQLLLYDIMTERFEITNILQRLLVANTDIFGQLKQGTAEQPAISSESVHYLYKYVSGKVLVRPAWFFDVNQQGEAIADVGTHLVDLNQWICFSGQQLDYRKDITVVAASHWPTMISATQFHAITQGENFPASISKLVQKDSLLPYYCNGKFTYLLKDIYTGVTVRWDYQSEHNSGDIYHSLIKGTKANLEVKQGPEEQYKPVLYITPLKEDTLFTRALRSLEKDWQKDYPGIAFQKISDVYKVIIPTKYAEGHEAHFGKVTTAFLGFLKYRNMPAWEVPGMIAKYYTTTTALAMAKAKDHRQ